MSHEHPVIDTDVYFRIDTINRSVINASETKRTLFKGDHNSERFTFEILRDVDGHDISECDVVEIHWINQASGTGSRVVADIYTVQDMHVSEDDNELVLFSWLISGASTQYVGPLNFSVRFICTDGNGECVYIWNTAIHVGVSIIDTINNTDRVTAPTSDIMRQWSDSMVNQLAKVESVESAEDTANLVIEENGVIKKISLNAMGSSCGGMFVVNLEWDDSDEPSCDKTLEEIVTAFNNGMLPVMVDGESVYNLMYNPSAEEGAVFAATEVLPGRSEVYFYYAKIYPGGYIRTAGLSLSGELDWDDGEPVEPSPD